MNFLLVLVVIGAFWLGMGALNRIFNLSRFKIEFMDIMLVWRTERLNGFIDSVSRRFGSFWNIYGWVGVLFSSLGIIYVLYSIIRNAYTIVVSPATSSAGVQFVIPGVTIPFLYPMIGLVILLFAHEFSHGIMARYENINVKSVGLMFLVAIPGAFVEPDEEAIKQAPRSSRLKLYAAGSFANFIVAALAYLLLIFLVAPSLQGSMDGVMVTEVVKDTPAEKALQRGTIIRGINGTPTPSADDFSAALRQYAPGDKITLNTTAGDLAITLAQNPANPSVGYIGINMEQHFEGHLDSLYHCLFWIFQLNFGIGLMNLLPITFVLDGGKMVKEYLEMILPTRAATIITMTVGVLSILLLVVNIIPGILR